MILDHLLTPHIRINSKWIKDLNVRPQMIKNPRREHRQQNLRHCSQKFFYQIYLPRHGNKRKNKHMGLHQTKKFCTAKEINNKIKRQPTEWENIFADTSDKGLISQIYKVLTKLNTKTTSNPIKKWAEELNRHFFQRGHTDGQ